MWTPKTTGVQIFLSMAGSDDPVEELVFGKEYTFDVALAGNDYAGLEFHFQVMTDSQFNAERDSWTFRSPERLRLQRQRLSYKFTPESSWGDASVRLAFVQVCPEEWTIEQRKAATGFGANMLYRTSTAR